MTRLNSDERKCRQGWIMKKKKRYKRYSPEFKREALRPQNRR